MSSLLPILCLVGAAGLLAALSIIDLRTRLLPNELVAALAILGVLFQLATHFRFAAPLQMAAGAGLGAGLLYAIRAVGSALYKEDALGLGDVKLMGAGGLWLGPDDILLALAAGAFIASLHGLAQGVWNAHRTKTRPNFARLKVPAGPGFAGGLVIGGLIRFWHP